MIIFRSHSFQGSQKAIRLRLIVELTINSQKSALHFDGAQY